MMMVILRKGKVIREDGNIFKKGEYIYLTNRENLVN